MAPEPEEAEPLELTDPFDLSDEDESEPDISAQENPERPESGVVPDAPEE